MSGSWEILLQGDATDLRMLCETLTEPSCRILETDGKFLLVLERRDDGETARDALRRAEDLVQIISGLARMHLGSPGRISTGGIVYEVSESGSRGVSICPPCADTVIRGYPPTVIAGESASRPADPVREHLRIASQDGAVRKALRLRDRGNLGWVELYRLFEVIDADVGVRKMISEKWASGAQIKRFQRTANSVGAVGDEARHGKESTMPPPHPMSLNAARGMVDRVLRSWIEWKTTGGK